jgi:FkbM family methyltransferase
MSATFPAVRARRAIANAATTAQPMLRRVARAALRRASFTRALNAAEERFGERVLYPRRDFRVSDLASFLFHDNDVGSEFRWTCRVAGTTFVVPVDPAFPHPSPRNDPWGPATYWRRPENRRTRQFYEEYLRRVPSGTLLDVGANWGMHVYPFAASGHRVVCFEPQSICCAFIRRVCDLNAFTRVTVVEKGVGARSQAEVPFFESDMATVSSMTEEHVTAFQHPWRRRTIECVTLDASCRAQNVSPTFIKIDAEGFEWEILQGSAAVLGDCKPDLLMEVSTSAEKQQAMWDYLATAGYRCYWIKQYVRGPYPKRPFLLIQTSREFLASGADSPDGYNADRDFIFLQPRHDVLAGC